jgi:CHASE2 domain-containing sensor protein
VFLLFLLGQLDGLERWYLDTLFALRGPRLSSTPIVIVAIDEASITELGQWPIPRAAHARAIDRIAEGRPLAIGVDLIFDAPSPRGAGDDRALAEAIRRAGNVVLAAILTVERHGSKLLREDVTLPTRDIRAGAAAVAAVQILIDSDGVVRRAPLTVRQLPSFAVALYEQARKAGLNVRPLPSRSEVIINYVGGPQTFPRIPFLQLVRGDFPPHAFRDKIVLIGATSSTLHDVFASPVARDGSMPGVEIHANVIDTFLRGNALREPVVWFAVLIVAVAALTSSLLVTRLRIVRAVYLAALLGMALLGGAYVAFAFWQVWARGGVAAVLALVLGFFLTVLHAFIAEERQQRGARPR